MIGEQGELGQVIQLINFFYCVKNIGMNLETRANSSVYATDSLISRAFFGLRWHNVRLILYVYL